MVVTEGSDGGRFHHPGPGAGAGAGAGIWPLYIVYGGRKVMTTLTRLLPGNLCHNSGPAHLHPSTTTSQLHYTSVGDSFHDCSFNFVLKMDFEVYLMD